MRIICCWCSKQMGEKEPLEDDRTSHGMCSVCEEKMNEKMKETE